MIVGEDFFLSHHLFVPYGQHRLYLTYTGGSVVDLGLPLSTWKHAAPAANAAPGTPANASELFRRGLAYAAQREFHRALTTLERTCRIEPKNAKFRFALGTVYWQDNQPDNALKDFDATIRLQPDDTHARLARAELQLARKDWPDPAAQAAAVTEVRADLDAVARLSLDGLYDGIGQYSAAIHQVDLWLSYHRQGRLLAFGLNDRCWDRAEAGLRLLKALHDCDRALAIRPNDPAILHSRGLVYLRLDKPADAIDDYDSALKRDFTMPTSLYGRGLAELRKGEKVNGRADLAAAEKIDPGIAKRFARRGLQP